MRFFNPLVSRNLRRFLLKNKDIDWSKIKHFSPTEFNYPDKLDLMAMIKLDYARELAEVPFVPTSDWRRSPGSSHNTGKAFDISCKNDRSRWKIINAFIDAGFNRIGIYNKHLHADIDETKDGYVIWTGISR